MARGVRLCGEGRGRGKRRSANRVLLRPQDARARCGLGLQAFVAGLTANQIEFVDLIVNHLTEHGVMEAAVLYESPFTDLTPRGPEELFSAGQVDELVRVLDAVRGMAIAA